MEEQMAVHNNEVSLVREAIQDCLKLARLGIEHEKKNGGALGYPAATCLFSLIDAIGSFQRGNSAFTVLIDGKTRLINSTGEHIFILNSHYFGFDLTERQLGEVYKLSRSPLTHNALLGWGQCLLVGEPSRSAIDCTTKGTLIYLPALLERCEHASWRFLAEADKVIPMSRALREVREKSDKFYGDQVTKAMDKLAANMDGGLGTSAQASAVGSPSTTPRKK